MKMCMTPDQRKALISERSFKRDKYEWALRLIQASEMCCPQCRMLTVAMLNKADRMGVLSQVIQTTLELYSADGGVHVDDLTLVHAIRAACRSHGLDVQRFRIRHPSHVPCLA